MKMYQLVAPTSMGVRITPTVRQPVHVSDTFFMQATSAESNVLSIPAALGLKTKVLTTFVKDSPIAKFIQGDLRRRGIDYEGAEVPQGGPWGYRHQFNIADSGFGMRGPRVANDRAGEVGRTLNVKDFDLNRLFVEEGVEILHVSGLTRAFARNQRILPGAGPRGQGGGHEDFLRPELPRILLGRAARLSCAPPSRRSPPWRIS